MAFSRRLRISSRDKGGASDFLAFSNFNHTLDKGPTTERVLFCIFYFSSSIDLLKLFDLVQVVWYGMYFTDCVVNTFLWDAFLKLCVCIRCKLRREVRFKFIFIRYNMEPLGFLVFFLTLRARGMRRR